MNNTFICRHNRSYSGSKYITLREHMPAHHKYFADESEYDAAHYLSWAETFGPQMREFIESILNKYEYPEQAYNSCNGILHNAKKQPKAAVEAAAEHCLRIHEITYSGFVRALRQAGKIGFLDEEEPTLPSHENIRGKENYY